MSGAVPDEVNVSVLLAVVFTVTLPKLIELALSVRFGDAAAVPVPLSVTVSVLPPESLLEIVRVPTAAPVTPGLKLTCSETD